mmetsp:Transcript_11408/g.47817  ORF Transcript_11408/g.47817 Transcript_11408/m.47817 type:complete len:350 (-) Transcript_11408:2059-3108(-)
MKLPSIASPRTRYPVSHTSRRPPRPFRRSGDRIGRPAWRKPRKASRLRRTLCSKVRVSRCSHVRSAPIRSSAEEGLSTCGFHPDRPPNTRRGQVRQGGRGVQPRARGISGQRYSPLQPRVRAPPPGELRQRHRRCVERHTVRPRVHQGVLPPRRGAVRARSSRRGAQGLQDGVPDAPAGPGRAYEAQGVRERVTKEEVRGGHRRAGGGDRQGFVDGGHERDGGGLGVRRRAARRGRENHETVHRGYDRAVQGAEDHRVEVRVRDSHAGQGCVRAASLGGGLGCSGGRTLHRVRRRARPVLRPVQHLRFERRAERREPVPVQRRLRGPRVVQRGGDPHAAGVQSHGPDEH